MQRYFLTNDSFAEQQAVITGSDVHHIKRVMRFREGDSIIVCDENQHCYNSTIQLISEASVTCELQEQVANNEMPIRVDIAQALIRRERFEFVLQKATELGVHTIYPITMKYCIAKWKQESSDKKLKRWNTITKEASEQSHRNIAVKVYDVMTLQTLPYDQYDLVLVADEQENESTVLHQILHNRHSRILVIIGPEGGLHPDERQLIANINHAKRIGLGKRILRSESASAYILSVLSYEYEMRQAK